METLPSVHASERGTVCHNSVTGLLHVILCLMALIKILIAICVDSTISILRRVKLWKEKHLHKCWNYPSVPIYLFLFFLKMVTTIHIHQCGIHMLCQSVNHRSSHTFRIWSHIYENFRLRLVAKAQNCVSRCDLWFTTFLSSLSVFFLCKIIQCIKESSTSYSMKPGLQPSSHSSHPCLSRFIKYMEWRLWRNLILRW